MCASDARGLQRWLRLGMTVRDRGRGWGRGAGRKQRQRHMFAYITVLHASAPIHTTCILRMYSRVRVHDSLATHLCACVGASVCVCVCAYVLILVFAGSDIDAGCETSSPNNPQ